MAWYHHHDPFEENDEEDDEEEESTSGQQSGDESEEDDEDEESEDDKGSKSDEEPEPLERDPSSIRSRIFFALSAFHEEAKPKTKKKTKPPKKQKPLSIDSMIAEWDAALTQQRTSNNNKSKVKQLPEKLIYVLSGKYTEQDIKACGIDGLEGPDFLLARSLITNTTTSPAHGVYLAHLERYLSGAYTPDPWGDNGPHDISDCICEEEETTKCIVNARTGCAMDGVGCFKVNKDERLQKLYRDEPDRWEFDEDADADDWCEGEKQWYHNTILIIVPPSLNDEFMDISSVPSTPEALVALISQQMSHFAEAGDESSRKTVSSTCLRAIKTCHWINYGVGYGGYLSKDEVGAKHHANGDPATCIAECAVILDEISILERLFEQAGDKSNLFVKVADTMGYAMRKFGFERAKETFFNFELDLNKPLYGVQGPGITSGALKNAVQTVQKFSEVFFAGLECEDVKFTCCYDLNADHVSPLEEDELQTIKGWLRSTVQRFLRSSPLASKSSYKNSGDIYFTKELGKYLMEMLKLLDAVDSAYPILDIWSSDQICFPALLCAMTSLGESNVQRKYISKAITNLKPEHFRLLLDKPLGKTYMSRGLVPEDIVDVFGILERRNDQRRLSGFISLVCSAAAGVQPIETIRSWTDKKKRIHTEVIEGVSLVNFFLPLLEMTLSKSKNKQLYATLAKSLLTIYSNNFIGKAPPPTVNPASVPKPISPCPNKCASCRELNRFLRDDLQPEKTFRAKKSERDHVESMLFRSVNRTEKPHQILKWETIKTSTPRGLKVTKLKGEAMKRVAEWNKRCTMASREIANVASWEVLQDLFGEGAANALRAKMKPLDGDEDRPAPNTLADSTPAGLNSGGIAGARARPGRKRKAEVIDLT